MSRIDAQRAIATLHSFRFFGLASQLRRALARKLVGGYFTRDNTRARVFSAREGKGSPACAVSAVLLNLGSRMVACRSLQALPRGNAHRLAWGYGNLAQRAMDQRVLA